MNNYKHTVVAQKSIILILIMLFFKTGGCFLDENSEYFDTYTFTAKCIQIKV